MAEVDTSLYPKPQSGQDMFGTIGRILEIGKAIQDYRAKSMLSDIMQKNADPNDPSGFNQGGVNRDIINAPGMWNKPGMLGEAANAQTAITQSQGAKTELATKQLAIVQSQAAATAAKENPTLRDLTELAARMGVIPGTERAIGQMWADMKGDYSSANIKRALTALSLGAIGPGGLVPELRPETGPTGTPMVRPPLTAAQEFAQPPAAPPVGKGKAAAPPPPSGPRTLPTTGPSETASFKAANEDYQRASEHADRTLPIKKVIGIMRQYEEAGKPFSGPGVDARNQAVSFIRALPFGEGLAEFLESSKTMKDVSEAKKYLEQHAAALGGGLGHGTGQQIDMLHAANPSLSVNDLAALAVSRVSLAQMRRQDIIAREASEDLKNTKDYLKRKVDMQNTYDINALSADTLSDSQRDKLFKSLTPAERKAFSKSISDAKKYGYM